MIAFVKKADAKPSVDHVEPNRFDDIRKVAAARHRKADTDGKDRRLKQTAEDNRLL